MAKTLDFSKANSPKGYACAPLRSALWRRDGRKRFGLAQNLALKNANMDPAWYNAAMISTVVISAGGSSLITGASSSVRRSGLTALGLRALILTLPSLVSLFFRHCLSLTCSSVRRGCGTLLSFASAGCYRF
jgi:hypothetical protein